MNWRGIRAIIRKDLTVVLRSPLVVLPMVVLPLILQILMPVGFGVAANLAADAFTQDEDLDALLENLPPAVDEQLSGMAEAGVFLQVTLVYLFAPLFLVVPLVVSSVIAADSFVGERERKTLEALLYTPLTNTELLVAKMLTAWLAALVVAFGTFVLYVIVVNVAMWPFVGGVSFPNLLWLVVIFWVTPAVAGLGLITVVLVSSRVKTFQEAYQLSGLAVIPVVALILGQVSGLLFFGPVLALILGLAVWGLNVILFLVGIDSFRRDTLLSSL